MSKSTKYLLRTGMALGALTICGGMFIVISSLIMQGSDLIVSPFGLHGYNFAQSAKITTVLYFIFTLLTGFRELLEAIFSRKK